MQRTLIAVFDNHAQAQSAIEELVSSGFLRPQIRLSEGDPTGGASAIGGEPAPEVQEAPRSGGSFGDGIKNFLGTLFGTDDSEHAQKYADAVTRGHRVLTLTVGDESDAERATAIIERFGPVDIDERVALWSGGALDEKTMRAGAPQPRQQDAASMSRQSLQGGQGGGSQQRAEKASPPGAGAPRQRGSGVKVFFHEAAATLNETEAAIEADELDTGAGGGGRAAGPANAHGATGQGAKRQGAESQGAEHRAAATLNETEAAIDDDERYYLGHYNSTYAGSGSAYGHYAPAYKYGAAMAGNAQYRDLPWTDVNQELRRDWEGRNPGAAWDQFEASVRYGWERRGS